ncbi:polyribonucleotide nucleotidyltransferase [bacterium]|nr:polyribonucleotide nucleotidyltransferase [bacterium]
MKPQKFKTKVGKKDLIVEVGKLAGQANGSVTVQYGDTMILATAVLSKEIREGTSYFPLMVDYEEKFYAAGKIKGSRWVKREGRPSDEAILTARLVDRCIRPLFDQRLRKDVQVIITVFSIDKDNDPDIPAIIGASLALGISDIPWNGPIGACRIGISGKKLLLNPCYKTRENADLDLVITGQNEKINMLEAGCNEVKEEHVLKACATSLGHIKDLINFQNTIIKKIGKKKQKIDFEELSLKIKNSINKFLKTRLENAIIQPSKQEHEQAMHYLRQNLLEHLTKKFPSINKELIIRFLDEKTDKKLHDLALEHKKRSDGRDFNQIRPITTEAGLLPRTHGSGLFTRGNTQIISIVTLGSPGMEQFLDTMEIEGRKRFMHHYNFPPYSVGEVRPLRGPGRRDIGHGALAEKALLAVAPDKDKFPYTIRVVSETLSSNGSSSMGSVCASSLALMDAGIPIKSPVSGIAMGMMEHEKTGEYVILTDIQGPEDHHGDMDFKAAGTRDGITALQMDVKNKGVNLEMIEKILEQSRIARMNILDKMAETLEKPRQELSQLAPRVHSIMINPDKIRDIIGPGGKMINEIINKTGVDIDIEDNGQVMITAPDNKSAKKAIEWIESLTREAKPGEVFQGKVVRIMDFGAFVEILPNQDGLVHVSELADHHVAKVDDIVKLGDEVKVKVKAIDDQGRINLTMRNIGENSSQ